MILISIIQSILTNILKAIYEPFGFALLLAVFFMFFYLFAKATSWTKAVKIWWEMFRKSKRFRHLFLLSFYVALMLFRTLLNRSIWSNPLSNILGGWGLYGDDGELTTEAIENIALFLPFTALLYWTFPEKFVNHRSTVQMTGRALVISFSVSLGIESLQLLFCLGTFQLSDLCYNSIGGTVGGLVYLVFRKGYKVWRKKRCGENEL